MNKMLSGTRKHACLSAHKTEALLHLTVSLHAFSMRHAREYLWVHALHGTLHTFLITKLTDNALYTQGSHPHALS